MAFQIVEVLDSQPENILATILHQDNQVTATVRGMKDHEVPVGKLFQADIRFDEILGWKVVSNFEDTRSGIRQEQDGIHLYGRVHSILDYGDGRTMIDVYMQNGPEIFTVNLDATDEDTPEANDGLEVVVGDLSLYLIS